MEKIAARFVKLVEEMFGPERSDRIFGYLVAAWSGDKPLKTMFWIFGIAVPFALLLLFIMPMTAGGRLGFSLALLILFPYVLWALKSIWACSENIAREQVHGVDKIYLTQAAKAYVVMGAIIYFLSLFG